MNPTAQLNELRQQQLTQWTGTQLTSSSTAASPPSIWSNLRLLYGKSCSLLNCKPNKRFLSILESENVFNLDTLDFSRDFLGSSGAMAVAVVCSSIPSLKTLTFVGVGLDNEACIFLLNCFAHHSALEILDISNNDVSFAAGQAIKAFMKKRQRLGQRAVAIRAANTLIPSSTLAILHRMGMAES